MSEASAPSASAAIETAMSAPPEIPKQEAAPTDTTPAESAWYGELGDEALVSWVKNKAYNSPNEALRAHHHLEKFLGADKAGRGVVVPKDDSPSEEWGAFYDKIGRPKTHEGYELPVPEGASPEFAEAMSKIMYESGVPKQAAQNLAKSWNEYMNATSAQNQEEDQMAFLQQEAALKKEWGGAYDANVAQAGIAARQFGIEGDKIDALQKAMGYDGAIKFLHDIGSKIGDDKFIGGTRAIDPSRDSMTPTQAAEELKLFESDPENYRKLTAGDPATIAKRRNIMKYIA